jgi:hypothetical protein
VAKRPPIWKDSPLTPNTKKGITVDVQHPKP